MIYLGCDPGVSGAWVALDSSGAFVACRPLPVLGPPKQRRLDAASLERHLGELQSDGFSAFVEDLVSMPGRGAIGAQSSGILYGALLAVLQICNVPVRQVRARSWQKLVEGLPRRPDTKGLDPKNKTRILTLHRKGFKAALTAKARLACPELAVEMDRLGAKGEGVSDAFWIAEFGRRQG